MKIVLDTNVLLPGLLRKGTCAKVINRCVMEHTIIHCDELISETAKHLLGKF